MVKDIKRAKYGNSKVLVDGITFDSKAEARYYKILKQKGMSFLPISDNFCEMQKNMILQEGFYSDGLKVAPIHYRADFVIYECQGPHKNVGFGPLKM